MESMFDIIISIDKKTDLNSKDYGVLLSDNLFSSEKILRLSKSMNTLVGLYYLRPMSILSISLEAYITCVLLI